MLECQTFNELHLILPVIKVTRWKDALWDENRSSRVMYGYTYLYTILTCLLNMNINLAQDPRTGTWIRCKSRVKTLCITNMKDPHNSAAPGAPILRGCGNCPLKANSQRIVGIVNSASINMINMESIQETVGYTIYIHTSLWKIFRKRSAEGVYIKFKWISLLDTWNLYIAFGKLNQHVAHGEHY